MNEILHRIHPTTLARSRQLRENTSPIEARLWARLRDRRLEGLKFRRQHPVGRYIADFYCAAQNLIVEIDGDTHADQIEYDHQRTQWLEANGYRVMRFTNSDVMNNVDGVLEAIRAACQKPISPS